MASQVALAKAEAIAEELCVLHTIPAEAKAWLTQRLAIALSEAERVGERTGIELASLGQRRDDPRR